jgi:ACT domain-containing protein
MKEQTHPTWWKSKDIFAPFFDLGPTQQTTTPILHIKSTIPSLSYIVPAMADKNIIL